MINNENTNDSQLKLKEDIIKEEIEKKIIIKINFYNIY